MKAASVTTAVTATSRLTTSNRRPPCKGRSPLLRTAWRLRDVLLWVLRSLRDSLVNPAGPVPKLFLVRGQFAAESQRNAQKKNLQRIGAVSLLGLAGLLEEADRRGALVVQREFEDMIGPLLGVLPCGGNQDLVDPVHQSTFRQLEITGEFRRRSAGPVFSPFQQVEERALLFVHSRVLAPKEPVLEVNDALDHRGDHVGKGVGHFA